MMIKILIKKNKYSEIKNYILNNKINDYKIIKYILYLYYKEDDILQIYNLYYLENDDAYITIGIKIYLYQNKLNNAYSLLNSLKNKSKRNYLPFLYYYNNFNNDDLFNFYKNNLAGKYLINEDEYKLLFNKYYNNQDKINFIFTDMTNNILKLNNNFIKGIECNINETKCSCCNQELKFIDLTITEKNQLISNIELEYKQNIKHLNYFKKYINNKNFNMLLDAGNILYHQEGTVNINSFTKINCVINKLKNYNILVIIHKRHVKKIKKNSKILEMYNKWNKYETPYNMNDDIFFIYGSLLLKESYILTNDKLKDHQFKLSVKTNINNTLQKLIEKKVINYYFNDKIWSITNLNLIFPNLYSKQIQNINNYWHFPYCDKWICYKNI